VLWIGWGPKLSGKSSIEISRILHKALVCQSFNLGSSLPFSQLLIVCLLTPTASANCCWDTLLSVRNLISGDSISSVITIISQFSMMANWIDIMESVLYIKDETKAAHPQKSGRAPH
jgi:hypothetical protein